MRARHRLKVDQENDFDILTSDTIMKIFDQFTRAIFLALVVISSIALMVGGIGVMAIMTISVTERTREIGDPQGAGRAPAGDSLAVPARGRVPDLDRRVAGDRARQPASG